MIPCLVALEEHLLVAQLLGDVARGLAGDLDPALGEERAGHQHEQDVHKSVNGINPNVAERVGRRDVVRQAADRNGLAA